MEMRDGTFVTYEKYDDFIKKHVYTICGRRFNCSSPDAYIAYNEYLKVALCYLNNDAKPALFINRMNIRINGAYKYEISTEIDGKGVSMWSSNAHIYEATKKFVNVFRICIRVKCPCSHAWIGHDPER